jgi:DNA polymerase III delta prime subunit
MAALATKTMGELNEEGKAVYPLFQKAASTCSLLFVNASWQAPSASFDFIVLIELVGPREPENGKVEVQVPYKTPADQSLSEIGNNPINQATEKSKKPATSLSKQAPTNLMTLALSSGHDQTEALEVDPNSGRRKRRKTASPEGKTAPESTGVQPGEVSQIKERLQRQRRTAGTQNTKQSAPLTASPPQNDIHTPTRDGGGNFEAQTPTRSKKQRQLKNPPDIIVIEDGPGPDLQPASIETVELGKVSKGLDLPNPIATPKDQVQGKPKKILKWNPKTGTIGSPPAKKSNPPSETSAKGKQPKSRLLTIRYGPGLPLSHVVGLKIDQILNSSKTNLRATTKIPPNLPKVASNPPMPPKSIHPLFLGKAVPKPASPQKTISRESGVIDLMSSKGRMVLQNAELRAQTRPRSPSRPTTTAFAGFGGPAKILKFPGAVSPAWPWQGMIHIRGNNSTLAKTPSAADEPAIKSRVRKSKYSAVRVLYHEDIIRSLAADLKIGEMLRDVQEINLDDFPPLPPCLRLPIKHYETGPEIQRRIRKEMHTQLGHTTSAESSSEDEIQINKPSRARVHPALVKMYNLIATSMSAFDQGQCETQAWIHKHSPKSAAEVLQTGREAHILKEWLQTLTVKSVEAGLGDGSRSRASSISRRTGALKSDFSGKRKRKSKKLDGFVISSDEEAEDMDEISEPEDDTSPQGSQGLLKKTVIRAGDRGSKDSGRLKNAVLISGPHGCGKTGAVYAVAKELGFEIFEINPSSKRSGKDIMEKVGDMTRNHLVQRHNLLPPEPIDVENQRMEEALANDIQSGRQGTMNSFFKPKEPTKAKPTPKKPENKKDGAAVKAPVKQQKQSLILIEEVDILYEEDKQFWATVMSLIVQSKRPVIMTCNDESVVPALNNSLHAIVRFNPPPTDLAVDYMLLAAACEGHILQREAVKALYESRRLDLRASLTELNFWCQFAVGDQKCGLDWFYRRYPPGTDVDAHGHKIRVVSEATYQTGMGWLSRDFLESHIRHLDVEEETLHQAWDGWHLDVGDWQTQLRMDEWATKIRTLSSSSEDKLAALKIYEDFSDGMSVTDLCSGGTFAPDHQVRARHTPPRQALFFFF